MATLCVENIPDDLYQALRARARAHRKSIAAEVVALLAEHIPTPQELKRRRAFLQKMRRLRAAPAPRRRPFPSAEAMLREDRER